MDYSLLIGIHDVQRGLSDAAAEAANLATGEAAAGEGALAVGGGDSSEPEGDDGDYPQPTPPDSPAPSQGAFAPFPLSASEVGFGG